MREYLIDAILNYGIALCKKNNIKVKFRIDSIPTLNISPPDLSSILSNIFDNAVEANLKIEESKRFFSIQVFCYKNYLSVIAKNPYEHVLLECNGLLLTDKLDNGQHGYGLKSIKITAEKYRGTFEYKTHNNIFTVIVMLPLNLDL